MKLQQFVFVLIWLPFTFIRFSKRVALKHYYFLCDNYTGVISQSFKRPVSWFTIIQELVEMERVEAETEAGPRTKQWSSGTKQQRRRIGRGSWWAAVCRLSNETQEICFCSLWTSCLLPSMRHVCGTWFITQVSCLSTKHPFFHQDIWFLRYVYQLQIEWRFNVKLNLFMICEYQKHNYKRLLIVAWTRARGHADTDTTLQIDAWQFKTFTEMRSIFFLMCVWHLPDMTAARGSACAT